MQHKNENQPGSIADQMVTRYKDKKITDSRSPTGNWLGLTLEHAEKGEVSLSLVIKEDMTNPYGNIHGGMMSAFIDETIGWAVVSLDTSNHYTSLNLVVDFLYAAKSGEQIIATSKVIRHGKKVIHVECHVRSAAGTLLAKAVSNLIVTSMQIKSAESSD